MPDRDLPPGPRSPALLQVLAWVRKPIPFLEECVRRYGACFTVRFPGQPPFVFMSDPEAVREIFAAGSDDVHSGEANRVLRPLLGDSSLLLLDGPAHRRERKMMMPPFHGERMQAYGEIMRASAARSLAAWPRGTSFPLQPRMQEITLDVILRAVFGLGDGDTLGELRARLVDLLALVSHPYGMLVGLIPWLQRDLGRLTLWGRFVRVSREVDRILIAEVARRRAGPDFGGQDVLTLLLGARDEAGEPMTDRELRDEMITLLVAGHETTATTLCWAFHEVLADPALLAQARAELAPAVVAGKLDPQRAAGLPFLDAIVKETLRLHPIVPIVVRRLVASMRIAGHDLPEGVVVAPCIWLAHRRPDVWAEPDRFLPTRWLEGRPNPHAFFPFGGGSRRCLGMAFALYEAKIVLAEVLMNAQLRPAPGPAVRTVRRGIMLVPSGGPPVLLDGLTAAMV